MQEIWKDIEGYENLYRVSNLGRVKSLGNGNVRNPNLKNERILKADIVKGGYLRVNLYKYGKMKHMLIHRLVANAFIPNPDNLPQVNHIDEDKTNNACFNLEWCDVKYNQNYGTRTKRSAISQSKPVLCVETGDIYTSTNEVERKHGFSNSHISAVCRGIRKSAYGYNWRYI